MGNKVKFYRQKKGMTQLQLSRKIGISRQYLSDIETLKKQPTIKIAFDFSSALDVPIEELFYYM